MNVSYPRIKRFKVHGSDNWIHVIPCCNDSTMTIALADWGEVVFRQFDDKEPICRRDALYMLRCAEDKILRGKVK
jgi:hypothetical protein